MSRTNILTKVALIAATSIAISACDSTIEGGGGGGSPVARNFCAFVPSNANSTYSDSVSDLVSSKGSGNYQYSVISQPARGTVAMTASTGDYTYTADTSGAQGYPSTFRYAVLEDGVQKDTADVSLIYGSKRIMPLGDSITFGVTRYSGPTGNQPADTLAIGYRKALYDRLTDEGFFVDFVGSESAGGDAGLSETAHQGHPGYKSDQLALAVDGNLTAAKPDVILSHSGTNDLYLSSDTGAAAASVKNLVTNIGVWQNNNSQPVSVFVAKIIPSYHGTSGNSSLSLATIETFNTQMEVNLDSDAFLAQQGAGFRYEVVDQYGALDPSTDLTSITTDTVGLHPNADGYSKMADTWYDALIAAGELSKCD